MAQQEIVRRNKKSFLARRILLQMYTLFPVRFAWSLFAAAVAGLLLSLIALIAPVLAPFLLSAVLAYICLPPVDSIARKLPRWLAAATVMALLLIGLATLALIVLPMVESLRTDNSLVKTLLPRITTGGMAIVGFFSTVLLMPVVLFPCLRDGIDSDLYKS